MIEKVGAWNGDCGGYGSQIIESDGAGWNEDRLSWVRSHLMELGYMATHYFLGFRTHYGKSYLSHQEKVVAKAIMEASLKELEDNGARTIWHGEAHFDGRSGVREWHIIKGVKEDTTAIDDIASLLPFGYVGCVYVDRDKTDSSKLDFTPKWRIRHLEW